MAIFAKDALESEPANYTFTASGGNLITGLVAAYSHSALVSVASIVGTSASSPATFPQIATDAPDETVLLFAGIKIAQDVSPNNYTERVEVRPLSPMSHLGDFVQATPGTIPVKSASLSNPTTWVTSAFAIKALNSLPNAPAWVTPQNSVIPADQDAYIELAFSDPDPGDSMSASNWKRWTLDANDARVGAPVATYQPTPSPRLLIPAGTLTAGTRYEFQADTVDSQGAEGPYSGSLFVTAANTPGAPTPVDPTSGQTIGTSSYTGVISHPTVDESEWTLYADDGAGGISTNVLQGPVTVATGDVRRHTFTGLANNTPVWWSVRVKYQGLWSQAAQFRTPVSYTPPPAPQITRTPDPGNGALIIGITNPAPAAGEPAASFNNVEIDDRDGKGFQPRYGSTMLPTNQPWTYWLAPSGVDVGARVTAVGDNGTTSTTEV